ncbi:30 kDa heat shock protein [Paramyrothecium foliicola]|nr:30 kDa heat shock protein [Paramyrothecium foliicola]
MAFFLPRTIYHRQTEPAVSPFFRLLSDVDRLSRRNRDVCYVYRTPAPAPAPRPWNPSFDAQETANVYLIRGALPGVSKENITIDFPEPQKIIIRGKVVEGGEPQAASQPAPQVEQAPADTTPEPVSPVSEDARSRSSFQATVEDGDDEDDFDVVSDFSEKPHEEPEVQKPAPAKEEVKVQPTTEVTKTQPTEQPTSAPSPRVIREFTRTYTFPSPVNFDAATADLKDDILTIVVPKPAKPEPRRITIN